MVSRQTIEQLEAFNFSPMNDVAFKFLFGSEKRKMITLAFLNAVLGPWIQRTIMDLKFIPIETPPDYQDGKLTRLDVACELDDKEFIDVEVQVVKDKDMAQRTIFYWTRLYEQSLKKSGEYHDLKPCITINILGFNFFPEPKEDPHDVYSICSLKHYRRLNNDMELHFLEIPKYRNCRLQKKISVAKMTSMERWLAYFANNLDIQEKEELAMSDAAINSAMEESRVFLNNTAERLQYLNRQMAVWDCKSRMSNNYEEGRKEGKTEGEDNMRQLSQKLFAKGRIDDWKRAMEDKEYCEQLKKEFGIS